jgi:hypothetical protein
MVENESLTGSDVADGAIDTPDLKNGCVTAEKLAPGVAFAPTWLHFDGTSAANLNGTYSQSGTTITVTVAGHGLRVGHIVNLDFTSGTATDNTFIVTTVPGTGSFTVTAGSSATTSGSVVLRRCAIGAGNNIASIADCGDGDYGINFTTPLADGNYAAVGMGNSTATNNTKTTVNIHAGGNLLPPTTKTADALRILVGSTNSVPPSGHDSASVSLLIIR